MPQQEGHARRTLGDETAFRWHPPAEYVEFGLASCFSFLRAASDAVDLCGTANALGYDCAGIADINTLAGVVRMHTEAAKACIRPLIGTRLVLVCGTELLAYPQDRDAYARLSTLLSKGKMQTVDGDWQEKDQTHLTLEMLAAHSEGLHLIVMHVMVCIRNGTTVPKAGFLLEANAERHLKPPAEMCRLFAQWPHAIKATRMLADQISFALTDLKYEYPSEIVPDGRSAQEELERLTWEGAKTRYPDGTPDHVVKTIEKEFALIRSKKIARLSGARR